MALPPQRKRYEDEVRALREVADTLLSKGWSEERVARHVVAARNGLKTLYRQGVPLSILRVIEQRNRLRYGDPIGPGADEQFGRYGSWIAVIAAACRPAKLSGRER